MPDVPEANWDEWESTQIFTPLSLCVCPLGCSHHAGLAADPRADRHAASRAAAEHPHPQRADSEDRRRTVMIPSEPNQFQVGPFRSTVESWNNLESCFCFCPAGLQSLSAPKRSEGASYVLRISLCVFVLLSPFLSEYYVLPIKLIEIEVMSHQLNSWNVPVQGQPSTDYWWNNCFLSNLRRKLTVSNKPYQSLSSFKEMNPVVHRNMAYLSLSQVHQWPFFADDRKHRYWYLVSM